MFTLCIRYEINPNKQRAFKTYVENEQHVITRCGGNIVGYFVPTDFAGPTNEGYGIIAFASLADYETYRGVLGADPEHAANAAELEASGAVIATRRSFIERVSPGLR